MNDRDVKILIGEKELAARIDTLAGELAAALPDRFTVVCLLKGSFMFAADLLRALARREKDVHVEFVRLSSYGSAKKSSGQVRLLGTMPETLSGQDVLLLDDILDSGHTLTRAGELLAEAGAGRVWTCVLLDKPSRREVAATADFVGFEIPDRFVVGYGVDFAERYRHLPFVATLD